MIVPFEINTGIFHSSKEPDSFLRNLAETILEFGVLPYSQELKEAVKNSPKFSLLLEKVGSKNISGPKYEIDCDSLKSNGVQGLIVIPSSDFESQKKLISDFTPEDRIVITPGNTELVPVRNTAESEILKRRKSWSNDALDPKTMDRELIWFDRIKPVLENSTKWFLVDANFIEHFQDSKHDGPRWLMQRIAETLIPQSDPKKKYRFSIFASVPDDSERSRHMAANTFSEISSILSSEKITVSLYSSPARNFRSLAHDRYIRCTKDSLHRRISLSDSFDVFDSKSTRPNFVFSYKLDNKEVSDKFSQLEEGLRNFSVHSKLFFSTD